MTERPILFSAPMVRAILDGRKAQTRRVLRTQPPAYVTDIIACARDFVSAYPNRKAIKPSEFSARSPFGHPGDRLWVREAFAGPAHIGDGDQGAVGFGIEYRADGAFRAHGDCSCEGPCGGVLIAHPWKPSIHMPRWASRITLEITDVRVERLRDISVVDAVAEGRRCEHGFDYCTRGCGDPVQRYAHFWDLLNAKRGYSWDSNPWVWVVAFKQIEAAQVAAV